ncbi:LA_0442/LA_0875 N-terminal domain-containing protein [Leptospira johnsonii]|uniref:LA_0442/LA_0875 N-terminal domain-containing protein n=1 Tax=Leptospira johnsonii TaxID=1917820 RepID=UPI00268DCBF0
MGSPNIRICLLILLLSLPITVLFAEQQTIYLRSGQILRGEVIQQTATTMQIKMEDGKVKQLNKKDIQRVSYKEPTVQEKKESEEKIKQQTAVVEEPPPPTPEPTKKSEPEIDKGASPYAIDQIKRKDLELYFGAGLGTYRPPTESYFDHASAKINALNGVPTQVDDPLYKRGLAYSMGLIYYWKKFAFGLTGNHFGGKTSERMTVYGGNSSLQEFKGTFPEKQNSLKLDVSYLAFSNQRVDIRPSFGYSQFWGKTEDNSTTANDYFANSLFDVMKFNYNILEILKGPSIGVKTTIRLGERWEDRIELHYLSLTGAQYAATVGTTVTTDASFFDYYRTDLTTTWTAKGFNFSNKLFYRWTPTISFWVGIQLFEWKYSVNSIGQRFQGLGDITSPPTLDVVILSNILIETTAKSTPATSRASSLEFGVMKRFELSQ